MSTKVLPFVARPGNDQLLRTTRVRIRRLLEDSDWIEAETGYVGVVPGLEGVVAGIGDGPGYVQVILDRNGEELCFHRTELEVIR